LIPSWARRTHHPSRLIGMAPGDQIPLIDSRIQEREQDCTKDSHHNDAPAIDAFICRLRQELEGIRASMLPRLKILVAWLSWPGLWRLSSPKMTRHSDFVINLSVTRLMIVFLPQDGGTVFARWRRSSVCGQSKSHNKHYGCLNADHRYSAFDSGVATWFCGRLWNSRPEVASKA
jgi:hypothetical protein